MKLYSHDIVDINEPVELRSLSPIQKIITSIRFQFSESRFSVKAKRKQMKELSLKQQRIEALKDSIMFRIYNDLLQEKNDVKIKSIRLFVDRSFNDIIDVVLTSSDFTSFNMEVVEEDKDMLIVYPQIPIMLKISSKTVEGDKYVTKQVI